MKAEYVNHMGGDLTVVNSARVSFDKEHFEFDEEGDTKLISYLARHGHWTPFAHAQITMRETVPIFIARQRFKHMIGFTYNEVSRRYVDDTPEFHYPEIWRSRPDGSMKQGSGADTVESMVVFDASGSPHLVAVSEAYEVFIKHAEDLYNAMIKAGTAPEQARMVLPQSMLTSYYVTGSLAAWARAYKQRIDLHAQLEIQGLAKQWNEIIQPLFPVSWAALTGGV